MWPVNQQTVGEIIDEFKEIETDMNLKVPEGEEYPI
jgi:hypothetical protein